MLFTIKLLHKYICLDENKIFRKKKKQETKNY